MPHPKRPDNYSRLLCLLTSSEEIMKEADAIKNLEDFKIFLQRNGFQPNHFNLETGYIVTDQILSFYKI